MKHVFITPYVYTTPLVQPSFSCSTYKPKVESTKSKMYSFDEFKEKNYAKN